LDAHWGYELCDRSAEQRLVALQTGWKLAEAVLGAPVPGEKERSEHHACSFRGWFIDLRTRTNLFAFSRALALIFTGHDANH